MGYWSNLLNAAIGNETYFNNEFGANTWRGRMEYDPENFVPLNGFGDYSPLWRSFNNPLELIEIYKLCSPYSSIIQHKAKAYADGKLEVLNANTDNYVRGAYKEWETLLNHPNDLMSGQRFFKLIYTWMSINGWCIILKVYPSGLRDRPARLYPIPFWMLDIMPKYNRESYTLTKKELLKGIFYNFNGVRRELDPDDLILISDSTGFNSQYTWMPESRMVLMQYPITKTLSVTEAEVTLIQKKGALGIITNQTGDANGHIQMSPTQMNQLQQDFKKYGLSRDQWQYIITPFNLDWKPITFPMRDLMTREIDRAAHQQICDALSYPYELTAGSERKNLANVKSFDTILYQNAIIPEAKDIDEQLMEGLGATQANIKIQHDYSQVPALQKSEEEKGKGLKAMNEAYQILWNDGNITRNQWLEAIGMDTVGLPEFNMYKWQMTPEQLGMFDMQRNNNGQETNESEAQS